MNFTILIYETPPTLHSAPTRIRRGGKTTGPLAALFEALKDAGVYVEVRAFSRPKAARR